MAQLKPNLAAQVAAYEHFGEAIRIEAERHGLQITLLEGENPDGYGSGVAVAIGNRRFIFTAAHVVRPFLRLIGEFYPYAPEEIWLLPRRGGAMLRRIVPIAIHQTGGGPNDPLDSAVIEINASDAEILGVSFVTPDRFHDDWQTEVGKFVALQGYPVQHLEIRNERAGGGDMIWTPASVLTLLDDPATWAPEIDQSHEIQIHYPEKYDALVGPGAINLPEVYAMSGGGFWACRLTDESDIWGGAKMRLMGTIVSWHQKERWVSLARIGQHISLIRSWYPDLVAKRLI